MDPGGAPHGDSFVRPFGIELVHEIVEVSLLLQAIHARRSGCLCAQGACRTPRADRIGSRRSAIPRMGEERHHQAKCATGCSISRALQTGARQHACNGRCAWDHGARSKCIGSEAAVPTAPRPENLLASLHRPSLRRHGAEAITSARGGSRSAAILPTLEMVAWCTPRVLAMARQLLPLKLLGRRWYRGVQAANPVLGKSLGRPDNASTPIVLEYCRDAVDAASIQSANDREGAALVGSRGGLSPG